MISDSTSRIHHTLTMSLDNRFVGYWILFKKSPPYMIYVVDVSALNFSKQLAQIQAFRIFSSGTSSKISFGNSCKAHQQTFALCCS